MYFLNFYGSVCLGGLCWPCTLLTSLEQDNNPGAVGAAVLPRGVNLAAMKHIAHSLTRMPSDLNSSLNMESHSTASSALLSSLAPSHSQFGAVDSSHAPISGLPSVKLASVRSIARILAGDPSFGADIAAHHSRQSSP